MGWMNADAVLRVGGSGSFRTMCSGLNLASRIGAGISGFVELVDRVNLVRRMIELERDLVEIVVGSERGTRLSGLKAARAVARTMVSLRLFPAGRGGASHGCGCRRGGILFESCDLSGSVRSPFPGFRWVGSTVGLALMISLKYLASPCRRVRAIEEKVSPESHAMGLCQSVAGVVARTCESSKA